MSMDGFIPDSIAITMGKPSALSVSTDKAMVYDETNGHYVLMSKEMAKVKLLSRKPNAWRTAVIRGLIVLGLLALIGMAGMSVLWFRAQVDWASKNTAPATEAIAQATPAAPVDPEGEMPKQVAENSVSVNASALPAINVLKQVASTPVPPSALGLKLEPEKTAPVAPVIAVPPATKSSAAAPEPVRVTTPAAKEAVKPRAPAPAVQPRPTTALAPPKPALAPAPKQATRPVEAERQEPTTAPVAPRPPASTGSATRGWAMRVERNGVLFFEGGTGKLYRVGEQLPNGERLVDVDESSATYATDKGIRQIRSSPLQSR